VTQGQVRPLLDCHQSGLTSTLTICYCKARDAFQLADKVYKRDQDLLAHKAIAARMTSNKPNRQPPGEADMQSSEQAIKNYGISPRKTW